MTDRESLWTFVRRFRRKPWGTWLCDGKHDDPRLVPKGEDCPACGQSEADEIKDRARIRAMAVGPSEDYKALLRGEIEADEYVRRLKRDVDARLRRA